jgi:pyridoxamine 5'-phosphate oxidase
VAKAAEFGFGEVPRPAFWSGFRIVPDRLEFWSHAAFRLHDRMAYERESGDDTAWQSQRLFP